VDELVVFGAIGKGVDAVLRDLDPLARLELRADGGQHFFLGYNLYCHGVIL
jgi:hypothetical protein